MIKTKKILTRVGIICLMAVLCAGIALAAAGGYLDVPEGSWYWEYVYYAQEQGLMDGADGNMFKPDSTMNRAMTATVLYRAAGEPETDGSAGFQDVPDGAWYSDAVNWASQSGIMEGYGDGTFGPDDSITREQMAAALWRLAGEPKAGTPSFDDASEISEWALTAVGWAQETGIMDGADGGLFRPQARATRAQAATVLSRYHMEYIAQDPETPEDPDEPENPDVPVEPGLRPNEYNDEDFYIENGYLKYRGGTSHVGVNVSSRQDSIDWQQVASSGVEFAMIRVGYRGYTAGSIFRDLYFQRNIEGALSAGMDVGIYFFSQAVNVQEAREEARQVLSMIDGYDITYPIAFDWERMESSSSRTKNVSIETVTQCARAFCQVIEEAGYDVVIYSVPSEWGVDLDLELLEDYPLWIANYTKEWEPTRWPYHYDMWQYTDSGSVPGITGQANLDICMRDW